MGFLEDISDFFKKVVDFVSTLGNRFANIGSGFANIFGGIGEEFKDLGIGLKLGFGDILELIEYTWEFVNTYIMCTIFFITNLRKCILYYLLDMLGVILYLPIRILLWFFFICGRDMYPAETSLWGGLEVIDNYSFNYLGFHLIHYPKVVRNDCYNCKRLKVSVLKAKAADVAYDFNVKIPDIMQGGVRQITKGKHQFDEVFVGNPRPPDDVE